MKKITAILIIIMMLCLPAAALAEGKARVSFSGDNSAYVGEVFAVIVTFSAEENIAALQAEFSYDDGKVKFLSGGNSAQASGGKGMISGSGGAQSLSYSLEFRALKAGNAAIEIENAEVISDETGMVLGSPSGAVTIVIEEAPEQVPEEQPEETTETEELPTEEETAEEQPVEKTDADVIIINGKKYIPADSGITGYMLLGDEEGKLWLYRTADGLMTEYTPLSTNALYQPAEAPAEADKTVNIGGMECDAYTAADGNVFVYLTDETQNAAWYSYDEATGMLRKAEVQENIIETVVENENTALLDIITLILAGLAVIAVIVLIVVLRRKKS